MEAAATGNNFVLKLGRTGTGVKTAGWVLGNCCILLKQHRHFHVGSSTEALQGPRRNVTVEIELPFLLISVG